MALFLLAILQARCIYKNNGSDAMDTAIEATELVEYLDSVREDLMVEDIVETAGDSYETECRLFDWIEYDASGDCPRYCGSNCEDMVVECGFQCCTWAMMKKCPNCHVDEFGFNNCDIRVHWRICPVTSENKYFMPVLEEYNYKGDGSEIAVWGSWVDNWNYYGCINHCYESGYFLYIIDMNLDILLHGERAYSDFPREYFIEYESECPIDCGGDSCMIYCSRFDVPGSDRTYWLYGWEFYYSQGLSGEPPTDRLSELPVLKDAVHIYRTSTWEHLETIDLLLLHQEEVYHVE